MAKNKITNSNIMNKADAKLQESMGKFENIIILGIRKDGQFDIDTTDPNFPTLHYLLNKAVFELMVYEKNTVEQQKQQQKIEIIENDE